MISTKDRVFFSEFSWSDFSSVFREFNILFTLRNNYRTCSNFEHFFLQKCSKIEYLSLEGDLIASVRFSGVRTVRIRALFYVFENRSFQCRTFAVCSPLERFLQNSNVSIKIELFLHLDYCGSFFLIIE